MCMPRLNLDEHAVTDWRYVAEGGANLVVAYTGQHDGPLRNTVLRLRKVNHDNVKPADMAYLREEDASVAFTDRIVIPLLEGSSERAVTNATPRLTSLPVSREWLERMQEHIEPARPATRRVVDTIDVERSYVVLAENLVGIEGDDDISVEIKPKWGFLPNPAHLSDASRTVKTRHCRFCLHRLSRETSQSHSQARDYCPLDLYSGDEARVRTAIRALVGSWKETDGKGNNLKLFSNGKMLRPSEVRRCLGRACREELTRFLQCDSVGSLGPKEGLAEALSDRLAPLIASSALVARLKELQAGLDAIDIEGLSQRVDLENDNENDNLEPVTLSEYEAFVAAYSGLVSLDMPVRDLVIAHLLSATFKDCSMFISKGRAALVDCDVKDVSRLRKYAKMDEVLRTQDVSGLRGCHA